MLIPCTHQVCLTNQIILNYLQITHDSLPNYCVFWKVNQHYSSLNGFNEYMNSCMIVALNTKDKVYVQDHYNVGYYMLSLYYTITRNVYPINIVFRGDLPTTI